MSQNMKSAFGDQPILNHGKIYASFRLLERITFPEPEHRSLHRVDLIDGIAVVFGHVDEVVGAVRAAKKVLDIVLHGPQDEVGRLG